MLAFTMAAGPAYAEAALVNIDEFQGLARNPDPEKIPNGAHTIFDNMYIKDGNLEVVKGRTRLNASAHSVTTVNGFFYYENAAGTTKKLVVMEDTTLVTYDVDGTNRTSIKSSLTNEKHTFVKIGDTLYITSLTDGLYKWTGSGSATAITGVSAPSSVDFSATTGSGGLTTGDDAIAITNGAFTSATQYTYTGSDCIASVDATGYSASTFSKNGVASATIDSANGFDAISATSVTYKYKVTKFSKAWGIESEASSSDSAALVGNDNVSTILTDPISYYGTDGGTTCSGTATLFKNLTFSYSGAQTRTTGTLASAPSLPFDGYRVYRTVAGGSDYFFLGYQDTGAYTDGKPDTALGDPLDVTIDTVDPPKATYIEAYKGTLFLGQGNTVSFSRLPVEATTDADTYWLATDKITLSSNEVITGLKNTGNSMLVFTKNNVYEITGFGASTFRVNVLLRDIGNVSSDTLEIDNNGDILFFAGIQGVYKLRTFQQVQDDTTGATGNDQRVSLVRFSNPFMDDVFRGTDSSIVLSTSNYTSAHAYFDQKYSRYFLYIGQDCLIFDELTQAWSYLPATKMNASLWARSGDSSGVGYLIDNLGFFYKNWYGYNNSGVTSTTVTGSPTSSGNTSLTDSTATFNTTSDGLKGLWVFLDNENGEWRQISSNTGTAITVSSAWTTNPITTDKYYIGYIIPRWQTKQLSFNKAPTEFTFANFYLIHKQPAASQVVDYFAYHNKETVPIQASTIDLYTSSDASTITKFIKKIRFSLRSNWFQFKFRSFIYNASDTIVPPIVITAYAMDGEAEKER